MRDGQKEGENISTPCTTSQSSTELMIQSLQADFERLSQLQLNLKAPINELKTELQTALKGLGDSMDRLNSSTPTPPSSGPTARR